jgi:phospholipase/carboxylesterase
MIPFMPGKVPNLVTRKKNIFMGAGEHDPLVLREQTEMLFRLFKKAGSRVVLHWEETAGLPGYDEILAAKEWLSNLALA